ncbi:MAG: DNA polymerase I [Candidatus Latescibacteria bacterium]|nr:DNA polymerase I [Candidatus Latescibacterota bacterium]
MAPVKRLFLVDGTALAYRSYFAFIRNPLVNSKGERTSAAFGFANALISLMKRESPDYLAVAFDTGKPTFRTELYPEYKATRQRMPDEMRDQLPRVREVVEAMRLPILEIEGFEADDLIGTIARRSVEAGIEVVLVAGDKDFMQLVGPGITIFNPKGGDGEPEILDSSGVKEKFGVEPGRVTDVLGLMGDTSDNIPGVPKVGPKTAVELVRRYGDLEGVLAHSDEVKQPQVRENLRVYADQARLSKRLATILTDVSVPVDVEAMCITDWLNERLIALFKELEFGRLLQGLDVSAEEKADYRLIDTPEGLDTLLERIASHKQCSFDLETTGVDEMTAEIVGVAIAVAPREAFYIPVGHSALMGRSLDRDRVMARLKPLLEDPAIEKYGQHIKYDTTILDRYGIRPEGFVFDTMVASYVINPSGRQHNLDALSFDYLNHRMTPISDLIGSGRHQISFADVPVEKACLYSCADADITLRLKGVLDRKLHNLALDRLFYEIEMPLIPVLRRMEMHGVAIDVPFLVEMSSRMEGDLQRLEGQIYEVAGEVFNINSTQQLGRILFETLQLPGKKRTKTGYATDSEVLEQLASLHPLPVLILDYRQLMKLRSTYIDTLPELVNPRTGRVHTSFNQTVTATGRLSSSNPNLQNIPIRTDIGREIRRAFIPGREGWLLLSADYSQIELRVMAHLSEDEELRRAFLEWVDVHKRTASLIFNTFPEMVTPEMRATAKTVNFGTIYGQTAYGLAQQLKIEHRDAKEFIDRYFATYPGVKRYIEQTIQQARRDGYVTTITGRRRYLPEITSTNTQVREFAERTAVNSPIQGTAADLIKIAMITIDRRIREEGLRTKMILQVHDELLFELPEKEVDRLRQVVVEEMEGAWQLSVPLKADVGVGRNWLEAH